MTNETLSQPTVHGAAVRQIYQLYQRIDAGDAPAVAELFATDTAYYRPGYEPMVGREQVLRFYRHDRIIAEGEHLLETAVADGQQVAINGQFRGRLHDGSIVELRFADFFVLNADLQITDRRTFYFTHIV